MTNDIPSRPIHRVAFRVERGKGNKLATLFAVLPDVPANPGKVMIYAHVGQHSEASIDYVRTRTRPATVEERASLLAELRGIYEREPDPVTLRVVSRITAEEWDQLIVNALNDNAVRNAPTS